MADTPCSAGGDVNCYNYNCSGSFSMQTGIFQRKESVRISYIVLKLFGTYFVGLGGAHG